jgi:hypothetical protein
MGAIYGKIRQIFFNLSPGDVSVGMKDINNEGYKFRP